MANQQEDMTGVGPRVAASELDSRGRRFARARRLILELGVAGLGYTLLTRCQTNDLLEDGGVAPDFTALDLAGNPITLASLGATPLLLHFWATWCGVCRQEFSALNAIHRELSGANGSTANTRPQLLTLAADEDPDFVRAFAEEHQLSFPILLAPRSLLGLYKVKAFPTSYYLEPGRRISGATVGMSSRWAMKARLSCASP
jgi:peroxiredoxin